MSLHHDLLEQARHLARREPLRPSQASLRRSVSAAYYAVFHLLAHEGASLLAKGTGIKSLRRLFTRGFAHNEMKELSKVVARRKWPNNIEANVGSVPIPQELVEVAEDFIEL